MRCRDHPRMRGEQFRSGRHLAGEMGSPPHARGAADYRRQKDLCAGDHPRMRGEQRYKRQGSMVMLGSPPHARGADLGMLLFRGA